MIPYIDLHCDTLLAAWPDKAARPGTAAPGQRGSGAAGKRGLRRPVFRRLFAASAGPGRPGLAVLSDDAYIDQLLAIYRRTLENHPHRIAHAGTAADLRANLDAGTASAF